MQTKVLKKLDRAPFNKVIQESIKEYIIENGLRPGDPLPPETELARQLGISRNSVREAVKSLESFGILHVRHGSGLYVGEFSFDSLLDNLPYGLMSELRELSDLLEVRRVLEVGMVESAMANMTEDQRARVRQAVENMRVRAEQGEAFPDEDREFHRCLFANLDNQVLLKLLDIFWLTFRKASAHTEIWTTDPVKTYQDHATIATAVAEGDAAGARSALEKHYSDLQDRLTRAQQRHQSK